MRDTFIQKLAQAYLWVEREVDLRNCLEFVKRDPSAIELLVGPTLREYVSISVSRTEGKELLIGVIDSHGDRTLVCRVKTDTLETPAALRMLAENAVDPELLPSKGVVGKLLPAYLPPVLSSLFTMDTQTILGDESAFVCIDPFEVVRYELGSRELSGMDGLDAVYYMGMATQAAYTIYGKRAVIHYDLGSLDIEILGDFDKEITFTEVF